MVPLFLKWGKTSLAKSPSSLVAGSLVMKGPTLAQYSTNLRALGGRDPEDLESAFKCRFGVLLPSDSWAAGTSGGKSLEYFPMVVVFDAATISGPRRTDVRNAGRR
jgi:hypothetical protein